MTPIKVLLTLALLPVLAYIAIQRVAPRILKLAISTVVLLGFYFVWVPDHATAIANRLGVGRGTDLLIYVWIVLSFGIGLNLHFKVRAARRDITELTRAIALLSAEGSSGLSHPRPSPDGSAADEENAP